MTTLLILAIGVTVACAGTAVWLFWRAICPWTTIGGSP